jgi:hypothetical protein
MLNTIRPLLILFIPVLLSANGARAQGHPNFSPPPYNPFFNNPHNFWYNTRPGKGALNDKFPKHYYKVGQKGGTDTLVYGRIQVDSPSHYLLVENKAVKKKDSARFIKIYPSQTRSIAHVDLETGTEYPGRPTDSCWLFKIIEGKMSAYTSLGEYESDLTDGVDYYLQYIQVGDGPLIPIQDPKALELFGDNEKASAFFTKKEFARAIKKYNKTAG